ncbi:hypothetical protein E2P81_ATG07284 [Venturia nashicola]|uniref:Uncharacterized protein n=1 Tax=Venturia nashicola TaxID=86259 RepID=A0A4Z1PBT0_9PEZI|nr:hypothetical protein E6O75_ATG07444 [Venturia nashicola]TLD31794.1 hypothetical protein E2P81_ATG07284 [Venturia nashicola]
MADKKDFQKYFELQRLQEKARRVVKAIDLWIHHELALFRGAMPYEAPSPLPTSSPSLGISVDRQAAVTSPAS